MRSERAEISALLVPKSFVSAALKVLNAGEPRWGKLLLAKTPPLRGQACNKGVYHVDYRDSSEQALRAIELPAPLDLKMKHLLETHPFDPGVAEDETLRQLLEVAKLEPHFQPLPEPDDLHPCPPAVARAMTPLPAQHESSLEPELMKLQQQIQTQKDASSSQPRRACRGAFRFAELFAGIGGFRLALERLGGECVFASELHPTARAIYLENWPKAKLEGDIRLVPSDEVPEHELLVGGFPCQPFSTLGEQHGLADQRGRLFLQICRILRSRKPLAALLENVPGILNCDDGRVMAEVLQGLEESGYRVAHRVIDSSSILPQKRRRVYFVAIRMDLSGACERFHFPWLPQLGRALEEVLEPITEEQKGYLTVSEKYWSKLGTSQVYLEKPSDIVAVLEEPAAPLISGYGSTRSAGPFAAVTQFVPQGEERPRMLSQRECARLQGFPESYRLEHCDDKHMAWYRAIGNAVSVPVVSAVAAALLDALELLRSDGTMPGTRASLLCLLDACAADRKSSLLRREIQLLPSLPTADVAALLAALESPGEERGHVPPESHPTKRWQRREVKAQATTAPPTRQPASDPAGYPSAPPAVAPVPAPPAPTAPPAPPAPAVPEAPVAARHKPPDPCPICLEGFEAAGAMPRTCRKCHNNFHQACLAEWAKKEQQIKWEQKPWMLPSQFDSGTCPCCRSSKGHDKSRRWKK